MSERGTANRDSIAGAAIAEAVLSVVLGIEPTFQTTELVAELG